MVCEWVGVPNNYFGVYFNVFKLYGTIARYFDRLRMIVSSV